MWHCAMAHGPPIKTSNGPLTVIQFPYCIQVIRNGKTNLFLNHNYILLIIVQKSVVFCVTSIFAVI